MKYSNRLRQAIEKYSREQIIDALKKHPIDTIAKQLNVEQEELNRLLEERLRQYAKEGLPQDEKTMNSNNDGKSLNSDEIIKALFKDVIKKSTAVKISRQAINTTYNFKRRYRSLIVDPRNAQLKNEVTSISKIKQQGSTEINERIKALKELHKEIGACNQNLQESNKTKEEKDKIKEDRLKKARRLLQQIREIEGVNLTFNQQLELWNMIKSEQLEHMGLHEKDTIIGNVIRVQTRVAQNLIEIIEKCQDTEDIEELTALSKCIDSDIRRVAGFKADSVKRKIDYKLLKWKEGQNLKDMETNITTNVDSVIRRDC